MACIMENGCDCIGVVLSGSFTVDGTDYEFFADPVYSREAGEARLNKFADDPVPAPEGGPNHTCLCGWIGFTNVREVGTTTTEPAAVRVFVHSNDILYVEVTIGNYRFSSAAERAVMWIPKYWAPGSPGCVCDGPPAVCVPPMPLAGSLAWPYTATPILIDLILTADDDINNTMDFNFSTNQDICKSRCVGIQWNTGAPSYHSYPFPTCGTSPNKKCPTDWTIEEWPWHRELATGVSETIHNDSDGNITLYGYYTYGFRKPYFPAKDIFNQNCASDIRDLGRGWRPGSTFDVQSSKWWQVSAGSSWGTTEPTTPGTIYWSFTHDCTTYYKVETVFNTPPDYPNFALTMPCGGIIPPANGTEGCNYIQFQDFYQGTGSYTVPAGFSFSQLNAQGGEYIYPSWPYVKISAERRAQSTTAPCVDAEGTPNSHCYSIDGITLSATAPAPSRTRHEVPPQNNCIAFMAWQHDPGGSGWYSVDAGFFCGDAAGVNEGWSDCVEDAEGFCYMEEIKIGPVCTDALDCVAWDQTLQWFPPVHDCPCDGGWNDCESTPECYPPGGEVWTDYTCAEAKQIFINQWGTPDNYCDQQYGMVACGDACSDHSGANPDWWYTVCCKPAPVKCRAFFVSIYDTGTGTWSAPAYQGGATCDEPCSSSSWSYLWHNCYIGNIAYGIYVCIDDCVDDQDCVNPTPPPVPTFTPTQCD